MKRIAIISELALGNFNYGNRLQSYALNYYLNNKYESINTESLIFLNRNKKKRTRITYQTVINFLKRFQKEKGSIYDFSNRLKKSDSFMNNNIKIRLIKNKELKNTLYDLFIVGSDVVWCQFPRGVNRIKFLDFKTKGGFKKISYSASFGRDYIPKENKKYLTKVLKQFDFISVREKSSINLLKTIGINNVCHTCDPTLLLDKNHWSSISKKVAIKDKYIFVYLLGKDKKQREEITKIANSLNLKIVTIPHADGIYNEVDNDFGDYRLDDCSPEEWIYLIENSEYVITDSFHGIVFSTIFEKKFIALKREFLDDINNRLIDYLNTINESDKYISSSNLDLKKLNWDYNKINDKLNKFINESKQYLDKVL